MLGPWIVLYCQVAVLCCSVTAVYTVNRYDDGDLNSFTLDEKKPVYKKYEPTWESLDKRPLPAWYDDAKFGIFIHWGVFSVPSFGSEWFWNNWKTETKSTTYRRFMKQRYPPNFTYQDFAKEFTAEFYNATQWSEILAASGAKYVVLTSKHHEGYTLWPSKYSFSWNSMDVGPNRDLVGELARAIRRNGEMKFGLYHSLYEWYNPLWLADKSNNYTTDNYVKSKTLPELYELIKMYKPEVVWSDGDWDAPDTYWKSKEFLSWLYNDSPVKDTIVVNDRWGRDIPCHHGDFYTCTDRYNPGVLQPHKWENCMTIDKKSWGYRRNAKLSDYLTTEDLIEELVTTVSCGGNLLMNVGPTKDGIIAPIFEQRLRDVGDWLSVNGDAIFGTVPWTYQNDTVTGDAWFTQDKNGANVWCSFLSWPKTNVLRLNERGLESVTAALMSTQDGEKKAQFDRHDGVLEVNLPPEEHRGQPAWVIRFSKSQK